MLLGTVGASLLRKLVRGKRVTRAGAGAMAARQGRGTIRAGLNF